MPRAAAIDSAGVPAESLSFSLNGARVVVASYTHQRLLDVLRDVFGLTGTKEGCGEGVCGSCTVLVDGRPVKSCTVAAASVAGKRVETIEGVGTPKAPHPLQRAFVESGAVQCGFCTPGMIMRAKALLDGNPAPSREEIKRALRGNLCRCTGYKKIVEAVEYAASSAASRPRQGTGEPALPSDLREVNACAGTSVPQEDVWDKVMGRLRYAADFTPPRCAYVRVVRSTRPHALITSLDIASAESVPGVLHVLTVSDVKGSNRTGAIQRDKPLLCGERVRFVGDAIALVVADSLACAQQGADAVVVTYQDLPVIMGPEQALATESVPIHPSGNLLADLALAKGDADGALAALPAVVEGTFETSFVEHAYLEPEAGVAWRERGRVVLRLSTQNPHENQEQVAAALGLAVEDVRVIQAPTGGAFGGKVTHDVAGHLALAALAVDRPVKLVYTRSESLLTTDKRHPFRMRVRIGASWDGKLAAVSADMLADTGAYASWGKAVGERALIHVAGPYDVPNVRAGVLMAYTNVTPAGAMRGFGCPQTSFARESLVDELSDRLGIDPLEFRRRNIFRPGSVTATGQVLETSVGAASTLEALVPWYEEAQEWAARGTPQVRRGVGLSSIFFGISEGGIRTDSRITLRLADDGTVEILAGVAELGQGVFCVLRQIAAETMGLPLQAFRIIPPDTALMPSGGATEASRQTLVSGNATQRAATQLRRVLDGLPLQPFGHADRRAWLAAAYAYLREMGRPIEEVGYYQPANQPVDRSGRGIPHIAYSFASHLAQVEVDERDAVKVIRLVAAHDVGLPMNPRALEGQIEGGLMMALGMALSEEYVPGETDRLSRYRIPRATDMPEIVNIILEEECPEGPFGAKGVGEVPAVGPAAAISNAVARATGTRPTRLPVRL